MPVRDNLFLLRLFISFVTADQNNHFMPARSLPQPCTGGMMPGRTRSFHTSALMLVKVGLPYSSSIAGMTCSDIAAPPGTEIASASGQVLAASRPTSRAISKPCSKVMANESDAHWLRFVMPTTSMPPASR